MCLPTSIYSLARSKWQIGYCRYMIENERVAGKDHILFAVNKFSRRQRVMLKFYTSSVYFENSRDLHSCLSANCVCESVRRSSVSLSHFGSGCWMRLMPPMAIRLASYLKGERKRLMGG